jgi:RHS repeat-associated protein
VTSIVHVFPNNTGDNATYTYTYDPSGRDASRVINNSAYRHHPTAASTTYATANALNQYPSVGGYPYSYWQEGELNETDTLQTNYNEFGKLMLAYITTTPGTIDPNNFDFMGVDALDNVYYHGRQTAATENSHPFIYHATDGLRPETVLELQCLQAGGGTPACSGTGTGARRYILGPDPDERWAFLDMDGTVYAPHTDREGTTIALGAGGAAALKLSYDAYGQSPNAASATDVGPGVNSYLYRYTGQRLDPNTQLFDYKARDYSPVLGRFYQPDPAGVDVGPNLYEYVGDEPLGGGDPGGECNKISCHNDSDSEFGAFGIEGSSSEGSAIPGSLAAAPAQSAANSAGPLKPMKGTAGTVSTAVNHVASKPNTSATVSVSGVKVDMKRGPDSSVSVNAKTPVGSINATGVISNPPGKAEIDVNDVNMTSTIGKVESAPTNFSLFDANGQLRYELHPALTITIPPLLPGLPRIKFIDIAAGQHVIAP